MKMKIINYSKYFVCALFVTILFCRCNNQEVENKSTNLVSEFDNGSYHVIQLDSCEYITSIVYGGRSICHKGNCKYCMQRVNANK